MPPLPSDIRCEWCGAPTNTFIPRLSGEGLVPRCAEHRWDPPGDLERGKWFYQNFVVYQIPVSGRTGRLVELYLGSELHWHEQIQTDIDRDAANCYVGRFWQIGPVLHHFRPPAMWPEPF